MDKTKVLHELGERTADPFQVGYCMKFIQAIEDDTRLGKILIELLEYAEHGNFK